MILAVVLTIVFLSWLYIEVKRAQKLSKEKVHMGKYKEFDTAVYWDDVIEMYRGVVTLQDEAIGDFYVLTKKDMKTEFHKTVDTYLEVCREKGIETNVFCKKCKADLTYCECKK